MQLNRRNALRILTTGCVAATGARVAAAAAHDSVEASPQAVGMLYDATVCIGCKSCEVACNSANGLPPDTGASGGLHQEPKSLNAHTKNIIKIFQQPNGQVASFMKQQCMHCVDPACVAGCPMGALNKDSLGIVGWNGSLCIGCRY